MKKVSIIKFLFQKLESKSDFLRKVSTTASNLKPTTLGKSVTGENSMGGKKKKNKQIICRCTILGPQEQQPLQVGKDL